MCKNITKAWICVRHTESEGVWLTVQAAGLRYAFMRSWSISRAVVHMFHLETLRRVPHGTEDKPAGRLGATEQSKHGNCRSTTIKKGFAAPYIHAARKTFCIVMDGVDAFPMVPTTRIRSPPRQNSKNQDRLGFLVISRRTSARRGPLCG